MKFSILFSFAILLQMACAQDEDSEIGSGISSTTDLSSQENAGETGSGGEMSPCGDDEDAFASGCAANPLDNATISTPISSTAAQESHWLTIQLTLTASIRDVSLTPVSMAKRLLSEHLKSSEHVFALHELIVNNSYQLDDRHTEQWIIVLRVVNSSEFAVRNTVGNLLDTLKDVDLHRSKSSNITLSVHSLCYNTSLDSKYWPVIPGVVKMPCSVPRGSSDTSPTSVNNKEDEYSYPDEPSTVDNNAGNVDQVDSEEDSYESQNSEIANSTDSSIPSSGVPPIIFTSPSPADTDDTPGTGCDPGLACTGSAKPDVREFDDLKVTNSATPVNYPEAEWAHPGVLAGIIGGGVIGLVFTALLVVFVIYRLQRRDAGSYRLDEPRACSSSSCKQAKSRAPLLPSGPAVLGVDFGTSLHVSASAGPPVAPSMYVLSAKNDPLLAGREYYA